MKLTSIFILVVAMSALFITGCATSPATLSQGETVQETSSVDEAELTGFAESDFIAEDEYVEIGELI